LPLYDFENTETGERFVEMLTIGGRETYLQENPHIKQLMLSAPGLVSGTGFQSKQDDGWKENLSRIAEAHPNSSLADKVGGRSSSKTKVREIASKHGRTKSGSYNMDL